SSMRLASFAENSPTSRNVSTWCSGMISRWTFARGLMSWIATKPFVLCTYAPSRAMLQNRQSSRCDAKDPLLRHVVRAHAHELADRRLDEEWRVVVAVPAARAIDEDDVRAADLPAPAALLELARQRTQPRAPLLLRLRRDGVVGGGDGARPRRVGEDVHLGDPDLLDEAQRALERRVVLGREADDDVGRQVDLAPARGEPPPVRPAP